MTQTTPHLTLGESDVKVVKQARFETQPRRITVNVPGFDLDRSTKAFQAAAAKTAKRRADDARKAKIENTPSSKPLPAESTPAIALDTPSATPEFHLEL